MLGELTYMFHWNGDPTSNLKSISRQCPGLQFPRSGYMVKLELMSRRILETV